MFFEVFSIIVGFAVTGVCELEISVVVESAVGRFAPEMTLVSGAAVFCGSTESDDDKFFLEEGVVFAFKASGLRAFDFLGLTVAESAESTVLASTIFVESESSGLFERFFTLCASV